MTITIDRAVAQQALEALEEATNYTGCEAWSPSMTDECLAVAVALKAALEQPEQEPEAFMYVGIKHDGTTHGPHLIWEPEYMDAMSAEKGVRAVPLYTHPPRREWRGLTEKEHEKARHVCRHVGVEGLVLWLGDKLKEKNHE